MSDETTTTAMVSATPGASETRYRLAKALAPSNTLPERFRGDPGGVYICLEISERLGLPLLMVAQNLYVVHGEPAWKGAFVKALIDRAPALDGRGPRYSATVYEYERDRAGKPMACRLVATCARSGTRIDGPRIDWALIKAEGWDSKKGSKWLSMPEMMLGYRAASWFGRLHCPDVLLGVYTLDELEDVAASEQRTARPLAHVQPLTAPGDAGVVEAEVVDDGATAADEMLLLAMRDADHEDVLRELVRNRTLTAAERDAYNAARRRIAAENGQLPLGDG